MPPVRPTIMPRVRNSSLRRERREAEAGELGRADLAEAARLGAEFGLGESAEVARVRVPQTPFWLRQTILFLIAGVIMAVAFAILTLVMSAWPGNLISGLLALASGLALWLLARHARSLVVWHRIYRYPGGVIQLISGEPEPRALRWAAVDVFTLLFYDPDSGPPILVSCLLEGAGTEIEVGGASGLRYPREVIRDVARDAERNPAPRIAASLVSRYETGEPVIAGYWRIDQAGVTMHHDKPKKSRLIPWGDVHAITVTNTDRHGNAEPPNNIAPTTARSRYPWPGLPLSYIPNGMFLPHLFEHIAGRRGMQLHKGSWPAQTGQ